MKSTKLVRAADILLADMDKVLAALKKRAFETKDMVRIGRSHGIHAERSRVKTDQAVAGATEPSSRSVPTERSPDIDERHRSSKTRGATSSPACGTRLSILAADPT